MCCCLRLTAMLLLPTIPQIPACDRPGRLCAGVALLNKYPEDDENDESPPFVADMTLWCNSTGKKTEYTPYSYIDLAQVQLLFESHESSFDCPFITWRQNAHLL